VSHGGLPRNVDDGISNDQILYPGQSILARAAKPAALKLFVNLVFHRSGAVSKAALANGPTLIVKPRISSKPKAVNQEVLQCIAGIMKNKVCRQMQ
jgi:hypothetical protein